ncbi:MAG TPA: tRNA-intron lyase [Acidobacteriota bacterium]|nr:tRNA-intron lyase [Acidobacteriota bacterium]
MSKLPIPVAVFNKGTFTTQSTDEARELFNQSRYGVMRRGGYVVLSAIEALYLLDRERLVVVDGRGKTLDFDTLFSRCVKMDSFLALRYPVFSDLRARGYIVKTALKFGADFRVYDRGVKPGDDHAKWIVYVTNERQTLTWREFSAKNRVAHATKKQLLVAVVDDEGDVTYYQIAWMRP